MRVEPFTLLIVARIGLPQLNGLSLDTCLVAQGVGSFKSANRSRTWRRKPRAPARVKAVLAVEFRLAAAVQPGAVVCRVAIGRSRDDVALLYKF